MSFSNTDSSNEVFGSAVFIGHPDRECGGFSLCSPAPLFRKRFFVREGLIDSASQADMEIYEDLTDCMDDKAPNIIDLEKYKQQFAKRQVICRHYGTDVDKVCAHIPEFKALEEKYGIKVYHVLPWVHTVAPEEYMDAVEQMKRCGAERFLAWNTNHMMPNRPEFLLASCIGNDLGVDTQLRSFYRVLSLDGVDISQFVPNWRG